MLKKSHVNDDVKYTVVVMIDDPSNHKVKLLLVQNMSVVPICDIMHEKTGLTDIYIKEIGQNGDSS